MKGGEARTEDDPKDSSASLFLLVVERYLCLRLSVGDRVYRKLARRI